jgi:CDP-diacylglycerol--serine O-phosphatidyltransferase
VLTSGNLTAGFLALLLAAQMKLVDAAALVVLAAGFDVLDGPMARRESCEGAFGANLDSLADLVSFGVVPAFAIYMGVLNSVPVLGLLACLLFFLCGAWRLARFPIVYRPGHYIGLPIPPAGVLLASLAALEVEPALALLVAFLLAGLMISEIPFPKPSPVSGLRRLFNNRTR